MKLNQEGDKCAMCERDKGEVPIFDEDIGKTLWICEYCDSEMFDNSIESKGLPEKESTLTITGLNQDINKWVKNRTND